VPSPRTVEAVDIAAKRQLSMLAGQEDSAPAQFRLQGLENGFDYGVDAPISVKSQIARLEPAQVTGRGNRRSRARRSA
jgi:hypothetical protein